MNQQDTGIQNAVQKQQKQQKKKKKCVPGNLCRTWNCERKHPNGFAVRTTKCRNFADCKNYDCSDGHAASRRHLCFNWPTCPKGDQCVFLHGPAQPLLPHDNAPTARPPRSGSRRNQRRAVSHAPPPRVTISPADTDRIGEPGLRHAETASMPLASPLPGLGGSRQPTFASAASRLENSPHRRRPGARSKSVGGRYPRDLPEGSRKTASPPPYIEVLPRCPVVLAAGPQQYNNIMKPKDSFVSIHVFYDVENVAIYYPGGDKPGDPPAYRIKPDAFINALKHVVSQAVSGSLALADQHWDIHYAYVERGSIYNLPREDQKTLELMNVSAHPVFDTKSDAADGKLTSEIDRALKLHPEGGCLFVMVSSDRGFHRDYSKISERNTVCIVAGVTDSGLEQYFKYIPALQPLYKSCRKKLANIYESTFKTTPFYIASEARVLALAAYLGSPHYVPPKLHVRTSSVRSNLSTSDAFDGDRLAWDLFVPTEMRDEKCLIQGLKTSSGQTIIPGDTLINWLVRWDPLEWSADIGGGVVSTASSISCGLDDLAASAPTRPPSKNDDDRALVLRRYPSQAGPIDLAEGKLSSSIARLRGAVATVPGFLGPKNPLQSADYSMAAAELEELGAFVYGDDMQSQFFAVFVCMSQELASNQLPAGVSCRQVLQSITKAATTSESLFPFTKNTPTVFAITRSNETKTFSVLADSSGSTGLEAPRLEIYRSSMRHAGTASTKELTRARSAEAKFYMLATSSDGLIDQDTLWDISKVSFVCIAPSAATHPKQPVSAGYADLLSNGLSIQCNKLSLSVWLASSFFASRVAVVCVSGKYYRHTELGTEFLKKIAASTRVVLPWWFDDPLHRQWLRERRDHLRAIVSPFGVVDVQPTPWGAIFIGPGEAAPNLEVGVWDVYTARDRVTEIFSHLATAEAFTVKLPSRILDYAGDEARAAEVAVSLSAHFTRLLRGKLHGPVLSFFNSDQNDVQQLSSVNCPDYLFDYASDLPVLVTAEVVRANLSFAKSAPPDATFEVQVIVTGVPDDDKFLSRLNSQYLLQKDMVNRFAEFLAKSFTYGIWDSDAIDKVPEFEYVLSPILGVIKVTPLRDNRLRVLAFKSYVPLIEKLFRSAVEFATAAAGATSRNPPSPAGRLGMLPAQSGCFLTLYAPPYVAEAYFRNELYASQASGVIKAAAGCGISPVFIYSPMYQKRSQMRILPVVPTFLFPCPTADALEIRARCDIAHAKFIMEKTSTQVYPQVFPYLHPHVVDYILREIRPVISQRYGVSVSPHIPFSTFLLRYTFSVAPALTSNGAKNDPVVAAAISTSNYHVALMNALKNKDTEFNMLNLANCNQGQLCLFTDQQEYQLLVEGFTGDVETALKFIKESTADLSFHRSPSIVIPHKFYVRSRHDVAFLLADLCYSYGALYHINERSDATLSDVYLMATEKSTPSFLEPLCRSQFRHVTRDPPPDFSALTVDTARRQPIFVLVPPGSEQYEFIKRRILQHQEGPVSHEDSILSRSGSFTVERIILPGSWRMYRARRNLTLELCPDRENAVNERLLWHRPSELESSIDPKKLLHTECVFMSQPDAAMFGRGHYFNSCLQCTMNSSFYSHGGRYYALLCYVALGKPAKYSQDISVTAQADKSARLFRDAGGALCGSMVNVASAIQTTIVPDRRQIYPAYLVTFSSANFAAAGAGANVLKGITDVVRNKTRQISQDAEDDSYAEPWRCHRSTKNNTRCLKKAIPGQKYCFQHAETT